MWRVKAPSAVKQLADQAGVAQVVGGPVGREQLGDRVAVGHQNARGSPTLSATRLRTIWFVIGPIW